jgi:hypothetical protein
MLHAAFTRLAGNATFHSRIVPSLPVVARVWPFGLNATPLAPSGTVRGAPIWAWVETFHSRTVPSPSAVARSSPFGLNATPPTAAAPSARMLMGAPI